MCYNLDIEMLRRLLSYDQKTGLLTWKRRSRELFESDRICNSWNVRHHGKPVGSINTSGYSQVKIFGRLYLTHHIAWALHYNEWASNQIDHINGKKTDNRIVNLRDATRSENAKNKTMPVSNKSGHIGVEYRKSRKKWRARITSGGKQVHLGYFSNISDAIAARKAAEREYGFHQNHGRQEMLR